MLNGPSGHSSCHECQAPRNAARSLVHGGASSQSTGLNRAGPMSRWRGSARLALKSVRTPSQPAFRPSMGQILPHAEPEAGALVPNTRFKRTPCAVPPAVTWAHGHRPRLELRNGRNGGNGPHAKSTNRTDLRTALLHSQDADAGATTTTKVRSQLLKISSQLELLTIYRIEILSATFFLEKEN